MTELRKSGIFQTVTSYGQAREVYESNSLEGHEQVPGKNLPQTSIVFKADLIPLDELLKRVRPAVSVNIPRIGFGRGAPRVEQGRQRRRRMI